MVSLAPQTPPPQINFFVALMYSTIYTKYVELDKNVIMNGKEMKIIKKTIVVYLEIKTMVFNILRQAEETHW